MRRVFNENEENAQNVIRVNPTSSRSADVTPFDLRPQSDGTRLRFAPMVVRNDSDPDSLVRGKIIYEKKRKADDFPLDQPPEVISKNDIKVGDSLELALSASETRALYCGLKERYELAEAMGSIPYGVTEFVQVDNALKQLISLLKRDPMAIRMMQGYEVFGLVQELLKVITQGTTPDELRGVFSKLEEGNIQNLNTSLSLVQLEQAREEMRASLVSDEEEHWQKLFTKYRWILTQVFSAPYAYLGSKFYAGGKSIDDKGGKVCDFIYRNKLTKNVSLIEIKTPCKPLLGAPYRSKTSGQPVFSMSQDLSGAVAQVLDYRGHLMKNYNALRVNSGEDFEALEPKCIVVIGSYASLGANRGATASFENFRNSLANVTIVTFDELLQRVDDMITVFKDGLVERSDVNMGPKVDDDDGWATPDGMSSF